VISSASTASTLSGKICTEKSTVHGPVHASFLGRGRYCTFLLTATCRRSQI
jgi:hypothetical protein